MRILHVTAQKPSSTGSGVYLTEVMASLASLGHEQALMFGEMPDDPLPAWKNYPVEFKTAALPFAIAGMSDNMPYEATRYCDFTEEMAAQFIAEYSRVFEIAQSDFKPDIIICHHLYLVTSVVSHLNKGAKVIGISHGTDIRQMNKHTLCAEYIKEGICNLDQIYVLHEDQVDEVVRVYGADKTKIDVLGTGYNSKIFKPGGQHKPNTIVYVGKICKQKGVPQLIEACKQIDGVSLTLVGGHSNEEEYQAIVTQTRDVGYPIELTGPLTQTEVAARYQSSEVFCLPSFFEGLPLVTLEAVACGCTAVMTSLPGIKDFYDEETNNAPIVFVEPPRMQNVDEPLEEDIKPFINNLAAALKQAALLTPRAESVEELSWDALAARLMENAEAL